MTVKDLIMQMESILNPGYSTELLGVNIDNLCKLLRVVDEHNDFIINVHQTVCRRGQSIEEPGIVNVKESKKDGYNYDYL